MTTKQQKNETYAGTIADRNKWLRNCLSCARLYECGAEKALLIWQEGKCINMEDKKL